MKNSRKYSWDEFKAANIQVKKGLMIEDCYMITNDALTAQLEQMLKTIQKMI